MIELDYNNSYRRGKILGDPDLIFKVRDHFSVDKAEVNNPNAKDLRVDIETKDYAIQPTGYFDFGLASEIEHFIQCSKIPYTRTENYEKNKDCGYASGDIFDGLNYPNRYYGLDTLQICLQEGRGTVVWATGAGKSFLQASLVENIWRKSDRPFKCIIVVPGLNLVHQLVDNFEEYGVNFTYSGWTGGAKGLPLQQTEVVISNSENFNSKFDDNLKWLREVDLVLVDECHKIRKGNVLSKNIGKIKTPHKFGFTGTLPKPQVDIWKITGSFGPVVYEKKSKELRDEGFLTNARIKMVKLMHPNVRYMNYKRELSFVYQSLQRNHTIKKIASGLSENTLILVNHIEHGESILKLMATIPNKEAYFICGEMPVEERQDIIHKMEEQNDIIVVAMASIFSTGINIKNLHYILFIAGGKSFIRIVQGIGRGLRLHENKNFLTIIDVYDNLEYSEQHAEERKLIYDDEQIEWKEIEVIL